MLTCQWHLQPIHSSGCRGSGGSLRSCREPLACMPAAPATAAAARATADASLTPLRCRPVLGVSSSLLSLAESESRSGRLFMRDSGSARRRGEPGAASQSLALPMGPGTLAAVRASAIEMLTACGMASSLAEAAHSCKVAFCRLIQPAQRSGCSKRRGGISTPQKEATSDALFVLTRTAAGGGSGGSLTGSVAQQRSLQHLQIAKLREGVSSLSACSRYRCETSKHRGCTRAGFGRHSQPALTRHILPA